MNYKGYHLLESLNEAGQVNNRQNIIGVDDYELNEEHNVNKVYQEFAKPSIRK